MGLCFLLEVVYNKIAVSIPIGCELCTARRNKHLEYLEAVSVSIAHRPKRSFYPHTALLSLAIHQGLLRKIALSAGKNPRPRRTLLTKTASHLWGLRGAGL